MLLLFLPAALLRMFIVRFTLLLEVVGYRFMTVILIALASSKAQTTYLHKYKYLCNNKNKFYLLINGET